MTQNNKTILVSIIVITAAIITYLIVFPKKNSEADYMNMEKTTISWTKMVHDFGRIKQNTTNTYLFEFTNTGKVPLLINDAMGSCGCTIPQFPKEPIEPGQKGAIKVVYKSGAQENIQEKLVIISANTNPYKTILKIRAFVLKH